MFNDNNGNRMYIKSEGVRSNGRNAIKQERNSSSDEDTNINDINQLSNNTNNHSLVFFVFHWSVVYYVSYFSFSLSYFYVSK